MKFTFNEFAALTTCVFFLYLFFEEKIYVLLWISLFELLYSLRIFISDVVLFKIVIVAYVVSVMLGYLYAFRYLFLKRETVSGYNKKLKILKKLDILKNDKIKRSRVMVSLVIVIIADVIGMYVFMR